MSQVPLSELIRRRRAIKEAMTKLAVELDGLDRLIFSRVEKFAEAFEGNVSQPSAPPRRDSIFRRQNGLEHAAVTLPNANRLIYKVHGPLSVNCMDAGGPLSTYGTLTNVPFSVNGTHTDVPLVFDCMAAEPLGVKSVADGAAQLLEANGAPMKTGAIMRGLLDLGIAVPGKRPGNNLSAHLSNDDRFMTTPEGWALRNPKLLPTMSPARKDRIQWIIRRRQSEQAELENE